MVSAERIADQLWTDEAPDAAVKALRVGVSRLGKSLGRAGARLLTRGPGYVLELEREELDLHRFERLVAEATGRSRGRPRRGFPRNRVGLDGLAEEIAPNATGSVWTIRVRDGIEFHNGKTPSAEDVRYSATAGSGTTSTCRSTRTRPTSLSGLRISSRPAHCSGPRAGKGSRSTCRRPTPCGA